MERNTKSKLYLLVTIILFFSVKIFAQNQYRIYDIDYFEQTNFKVKLYCDYLNINVHKDSVKAIYISKEETIKSLNEYKNLEYVCISGCNLKSVPKYGNKLKFIEIKQSKFIDNTIFEQILNKKELLSITIQKAHIKHFDWLKNFEKLNKLELNKISLRKIPNVIFDLKKLQILSLTTNKIKNIPKEIFTLNNLKVIYLMNNKIKHISAKFQLLDSLKILGLSNNPVINKELCNLQNSKIEVLYCNSCKLKTFPICLNRMSYLQIIDVSNNKLKTLPGTLNGFKKLWFIQISNKIKYIPDFYRNNNIFISKI